MLYGLSESEAVKTNIPGVIVKNAKLSNASARLEKMRYLVSCFYYVIAPSVQNKLLHHIVVLVLNRNIFLNLCIISQPYSAKRKCINGFFQHGYFWIQPAKSIHTHTLPMRLEG